MASVSGKKKGFFSRKAAPAAAAPSKPVSAPPRPSRPSPTPSAQASFTSQTGAASAAWPTSPEAPMPMASHGLMPQNRGSFKNLDWDQVGSHLASGQQPQQQQPPSSSSKVPRSAVRSQPPPVKPIELSGPAAPTNGAAPPASADSVGSPAQSETSGFKSIFGRGKGKHAKNQSIGGTSVASAASAAAAAAANGVSRSASMTSGTGSDIKSAAKGHSSKPSASSYFSSASSAGQRSSQSSAAQPAQQQSKQKDWDARSASSANTTFSAVSSLHPGASVPPPPLPSNSASFAPANGQIRPNQPPPIRVRVFIDHPTTEPLYVTVIPGVETLRSFKHKILKTDNERFIQFRQARRPPVETRWDISDSPFDDPKATGFDLDERIQLFRVSVNWLVVSKTKRAFEKQRTFTSILSCCPSTSIIAQDPNSLLDLAALFPPSAEAAEARLKGLIEIVVRITPRQSIPVLVSYSDMPDHPVVVDVERGMTVRDLKESIGEARTLIVRPVGGVQAGLENEDFYLFKCLQPCHKGPLPFDIDVFEGLSPETLFDDESAVFEDHFFVERTGWDAPQNALERVELVAFLTDDMEDDFRESLRMHTKQGSPSIKSTGAKRAPPPKQQAQPQQYGQAGMSPAKAYASQQRPSPNRQGSSQSSTSNRKEDRHRSMPVQPRSNTGSPRSQANLPPQASPAPRNKHLSHQPPPREYSQSPQPRSAHISSVASSSSVPNLAAASRAPPARNVPKINGTYSPVEMVSPSSSPVIGVSSSPRNSPRSAATARFEQPDGKISPRSPLTGGHDDDDGSVYDPSPAATPVSPAAVAAPASNSSSWSSVLINGLSQHKRSTDLDPLELSNVNEGLGLDDILQGYNTRGSVDSLGLTMSRKTTVDGETEGAVVEDLGESIDRKLSNNSVYDIVSEVRQSQELLSPPGALNVKMRNQPFAGPKHGGGFAREDLSPTSVPVGLPEDDSPRSSESGPPSYQTNSVPSSAHSGDSPGGSPPQQQRAAAPSPQSSEKTVQQRDEPADDSRDYDTTQDFEDEDMSERAPTPDAIDEEDEHDDGQSDAHTEQGERSLRFASITSSSNTGHSVASPSRGKFYHTASSGGRRNSYFNRTVSTGYPLRSAMKGSKAQARANGDMPPPPPGSPARATFRRQVNTKVGNRISRDLSSHRVSNRLSHVAIYQGKVGGSSPSPLPDMSSPSSAYNSPRSQASEDLGRKGSLVADGYALIGGALFSVSLKPMDDRGAAVMKTSAFQSVGQLWSVTPSGGPPAAHGTSF